MALVRIACIQERIMEVHSHRQAFQRDGFTVVRGFLPPGELSTLQRELDRYIQEVAPLLPAGDAFYQVPGQAETLRQLHRMGQDKFFEDYRRNPRWQELAEALLGEEVEPDEPEWFNKLPGTDHATPPHQDNHYFQLTPPQVLTMWLALDRVDEENGCLRYVAGSHHGGHRPHAPTSVIGFSQSVSDYGPDDAQGEILVCLDPGDLVVHHGETIHRADPNRSRDRQRCGFAIVYRGRSCGIDERARAAYLNSVRTQHQPQALLNA